jgi:hypothetical protein
VLILALVGCMSANGRGPEAVWSAGEGFWGHWADGQAEVDAYRLTMPRYGEARSGEAVLIFVTETFTAAQRVKSDGGHPDEYPVLKLNDVRHFQTGVYDYDLMTSVFVRLDGTDPLGLATRADLGSQEWCGNVYDQLLLEQGRLTRDRHSYFDGEADQQGDLSVSEGGVMGDTFPILVRSLAGEGVGPGETREVPWLPSLADVRLAHQPLVWTTATIARSASTQTIAVPGGSFEVSTVTVTVGDWTTTWDVEAAYPHRLGRWSRSAGEEAVLTGSRRMKYWELKRGGDEALRHELGLP